jgi:S-formylglutathione hydrolase FrmB
VELVPSFLQLLQPLREQMTSPTFASFVALAAGWVLCRRHTVSGALPAAGASGTPRKHHSAYHRVFSAARWSPDAVAGEHSWDYWDEHVKEALAFHVGAAFRA